MDSRFFFLLTTAGFLLAAGNILQRIGFLRQPRSNARATLWLAVRTSPWWWLGLVASALGTLFHYQAIHWYPVSLVQCFSVLHPLFALLLGVALLHEPFSREEVKGIALLLCGMGLLFLPGGWSLASGWWAVLPFLVLVLALAKGGARPVEWGGGLLLGASLLVWKQFGLHLEQVGVDIDAGMQVYLVRMAAEPLFWAYAGTFVGGNLVLQLALAKGKAGRVVPMASSLGVVVPVSGGVLLLYEVLGPLQLMGAGAIALGMLLMPDSADSTHAREASVG